MITKFKIFEDNAVETSFTIDNLIPYFKDKCELWEYPFILDDIQNLLNRSILGLNVKFYCLRCTANVDGVRNFYHFNKEHKGKIRGIGSGTESNRNKIYLTLTLNRIKYTHDVDTSKPITIFGDIPSELKEIIYNSELFSDTKKYNL